MTHTTNGHDGRAAEDPQRAGAGDGDSTGYTWARRSELAPPPPESDPAAATTPVPPRSAPDAPDVAAPAAPVQYGGWTAPGAANAPAAHPATGSAGPSAPSGPFAPSAPSAPSGPAASSGYASPAYPTSNTQTQPVYGGSYGTGTWPIPPSGPAYGPSHGPAFDPDAAAGSGGDFALPPAQRSHEPRRPSWTGVVAMGVGAAVLSSALTAGIVKATDNSSSTSSGTQITSSNGGSSSVKAPVTSTSNNPNWNAVAGFVEPSVVAVTVTSSTEEGEGSGVILDKTGRIVTNNHVATGAGSNAAMKVTLNDGRTYDASLVGTDSTTDIAVIQIKNPPSNLTPATLGDSESAKVGDSVMAVGNPLGLSGTVTTGIVSALDRPVSTTASEDDQSQSQNPFSQGEGSTSTSEPVVTDAIQTDAAVNPGNSGGALVDSGGRVIGIPSSIASLSDSSSFGQSSQSGSIGLGFAIPINEVKQVTAQLIKSGKATHSYLGVGVSSQDTTVTVDGAGRDAALIGSVQSGGPAAKAGIKANDAVIAVDGEAVNGGNSLIGQLRQRAPGTQAKLTVVRGGKSLDITVTLGTAPATSS